MLRALDAAGLLAAPGAEARAQAALRPLLTGSSAPAALLPLTAPPLPPSGGPAAATRRSPAKKGVVARVPAKRGSVASGKATGKAGAGPSVAPAAATAATAAGAATATLTTTAPAASKSVAAPPAASVARASALLAQHVARLGGAAEPAPVSAALQQLLLDCRACERFVPWWAAVKPADGASGASRARGGVPPAAGGRAQGAGGDSQGDSQGTMWWRSVLFDEPALAAAGDEQPTVPRLGLVGAHSSTGEAEAEGDASRARAEATVLEGVRSHEYMDSPLLALRAGRLGAFYSSHAGGGLTLSGSLGRQRLDPSRPVCRFELRGDCRDPNCSGQHRRQYLQSVPELCAELRAYAGEMTGEAVALPPVAVGEEEEHAQEAARAAASSLRARMPAAPSAAPVVAAASLVALRGRGGTAALGHATLPAAGAAGRVAADTATGTVATGAAGAVAAVAAVADGAACSAVGGGAARPSLASSARREREAQMRLLHAALSALPAPSLLQGDLEKQLQPLLLARRSSEAAALEAAVLEGAPLPSTASTPTHTFAPDILVAAPPATGAAAAQSPLAAAGGEGGVLRYWQGVSDTSLPRDDTEATALLERACPRCSSRRRAGSAATFAAPVRRSAAPARRLLSRLVEHQPRCALFWAMLLGIFSCDGSAAQLTALLEQATRHAPGTRWRGCSPQWRSALECTRCARCAARALPPPAPPRNPSAPRSRCCTS